MIENRIAEVLTERFKKEDLSGCFLVNVASDKKNKLTVYVDADEQLTIKMCQVISRFLEKTIEENEWMPAKYTLDVSSPGIDNPLRLHRQYKKNIGRNAAVSLKDDTVLKGKLEKVEEAFIVLDVDKNGKTEIPFENIIETKILVSFK